MGFNFYTTMILQENIDISHLSNFKTPAKAKFFYELNSEDNIHDLHEIFKFSQENGLPILVIGWGTNMLFAFDVYEWIIIKNDLNWWTYFDENKTLEAFSNEYIRDIAESLEKNHSQYLWHRFIGLPGSIGWAVYGNAWCFGLETENNFVSCSVYDFESWKKIEIKKKDMNFSYRSSILKEQAWKYFLINVLFDLSKKSEKYSSDVDNLHFRQHMQPQGNTCGSFFKNPSREQSAGYLIESVWLKWKKIAWAFFSDLHANFLMHDGNGKWQDLLELISLAQKEVFEKHWINLENEVRIITNI